MKRNLFALLTALVMMTTVLCTGGAVAENGIKEFTFFYASSAAEINSNNDVQNLIAEKIGAKCNVTYLAGQTSKEAVGAMIAANEYPDFIDGSDGSAQLMEAGALIPIDEYWDNYPNVKNYLTEEQWNMVKAAQGGHVYMIQNFGVSPGEEFRTVFPDVAFYIQTRVLKWANYPVITTLDEYFDLIDSYLQANPTNEDGTTNIGYEALCDDWRYFCIEFPPALLDGYAYDGQLIDPNTYEVSDYNTTPTAQAYFKRLNEEYNKGVIDPEACTLSWDQYASKIASGRVLGLCDQHWDFQTAEDALLAAGMNDRTYVPLALTISKDITPNYQTSKAFVNTNGGMGITTSCKDIEGAMQFLNDILSPEIETLRNWGVEGVDYLVNENGMFYRTEEMRANSVDASYKASHFCQYYALPNYNTGISADGINTCIPSDSLSEFTEKLPAEVKECLAAYGAETYCDLLDPIDDVPAWFPIYTYTNSLTTATDAGTVWMKMNEVKHEWLPKVVMASDFDEAWQQYLDTYNKLDIATFLDAIHTEVLRRLDAAQGK